MESPSPGESADMLAETGKLLVQAIRLFSFSQTADSVLVEWLNGGWLTSSNLVIRDRQKKRNTNISKSERGKTALVSSSPLILCVQKQSGTRTGQEAINSSEGLMRSIMQQMPVDDDEDYDEFSRIACRMSSLMRGVRS